MAVESVTMHPAAPIVSGTRAFRRTNLAMFAAGFSTFALLYCVQPLMPAFTAEFAVSPAMSSLTVSLTTGALSVMVVLAGALSDSVGRKRIMCWSLAASAALTLGAALATSFTQLLILRLLMGVALAGLPSVAIAYLGEEIAARSIGLAIGLFIGGSAFGGMMGRLLCAAGADLGGWRLGLAAVGLTGAVCAAVFWQALPDSRHFTPRPQRPRQMIAGFRSSLTDKGLPWLYLSGFLNMGSFVTIYNYAGFRLRAPPYDFSQTEIGALFSVYLLGAVASIWTGSLADRFGRRRMLWVAVSTVLAGIEVTRAASVVLIVLGIAMLTVGFFGAHAICSSWVSRRAVSAKAQAASLYLFFYYLGSSFLGSVSGLAYQHDGWRGIVDLHTLLQGIALMIAFRLSFLQPMGSTAAEERR
jgi:YNFM family putative membrane transporter